MIQDVFKSILLGIIQGFTEFLPVSSSGHIVLAKELLSIQMYGLLFEVVLHFGTFLSVAVIFRREIYNICFFLYKGILNAFRNRSLKVLTDNADSFLGILIIVGTIPGAAAGIIFKDVISVMFQSPLVVSYSLIVTGIILYSTKYIGEKKKPLSLLSALLIGCAQVFALLPGISRSGVTISAGIFAGISKEKAVKFSFFLSMPVIFGATVFEMVDSFSLGNPDINVMQLMAGFITAFIFGYIAVKLLLKVVIAGKFYIFSYYCLFVGMLSLIFFR